MEDEFIINDLRSQSQKVVFTNSDRATEIGYFMRFAEFRPEGVNAVGLVAVIIDKTGKVCYREPKSIRFVFE